MKRTLNCSTCGDAFVAYGDKRRRFCSMECRQQQTRVKASCTHCGADVLKFKTLLSEEQKNVFCNSDCWNAYRRAQPSKVNKSSNGYAVKNIGGKQVKEHRRVMEQFLQRKLRPHETVHHKNGVRNDNRLSNLELWSKAQPYGQRVEDKIAWAIEFLETYGYTVHDPLRGFGEAVLYGAYPGNQPHGIN